MRKDERVVIRIDPGRAARDVEALEQALRQSGEQLFTRAGSLVRPTSTLMRRARKRDEPQKHVQVDVLRPLTLSNLECAASRHVRFTKHDGRSKTPRTIDPPKNILIALLERGEWAFPPVTGVINTPTLRPDGSLLVEPGYDAETGLWHAADPSLVLPPIPNEPTTDDAVAALAVLSEPLAGYGFAGDLDQSVSLAAIVTACARGGFDLTPMFLFTAPTAGSGKSHLVDLISLIARGRECPVIAPGKKDEEFEKRLVALLLEAAPIVSLDNCTRNLDGELLCQMTERLYVKVRILGESKAPECEWRGLLMATGNNIALAGDMVRRGLTARLDSKSEAPEQRTFSFDPHAMVLADRGRYVAAALTIARAYLVSGASTSCAPFGSYGPWSSFVREPLVWLGLSDPVKSVEHAREEDPHRCAARALIDHLIKHFGQREFTVKELVDVANKTDGGSGGAFKYVPPELLHPELNSLLIERCAARGGRGGVIDARSVGHWFRSLRDQVHKAGDGFFYRIVMSGTGHNHVGRWQVEPAGTDPGVSASLGSPASPRVAPGDIDDDIPF